MFSSKCSAFLIQVANCSWKTCGPQGKLFGLTESGMTCKVSQKASPEYEVDLFTRHHNGVTLGPVLENLHLKCSTYSHRQWNYHVCLFVCLFYNENTSFSSCHKNEFSSFPKYFSIFLTTIDDYSN